MQTRLVTVLLIAGCSSATPQATGGAPPGSECEAARDCAAPAPECDNETLRHYEASCVASTCTVTVDETPCALGCGDARCLALAPALVPDACAGPFGAPLTIADGTHVIDTDLDCEDIVAQADGPELCVVRGDSITIAAGATVRGTGSRPLVLVSHGELSIAGTVDVSAVGVTSGPGARLDGVAVGGTLAGYSNIGGGGGGHATAGSAGGGWIDVRSSSVTKTTLGPAGGATVGAPTLQPLAGGGRGGSNADVTNGGGGGGGVALISCAGLHLASTARLLASGGGGGPASMTCRGGGGGGAGGAILIEAAQLDIEAGAGAFANGGSGGMGGPWQQSGEFGGCGTSTTPGQDGRADVVPAGAFPGFGGALMQAPTAGTDAHTHYTGYPENGANGGGGAAGRIRINHAGSTAPLGNLTASPKPVAGTVAAE